MYKSKLLWLALIIGATGVWWQRQKSPLPPRLESMGFSAASTSKGNKPRLALVIGNGKGYKGGGFKTLLTPENDASDMASTLSDLGFEVIKELNADKATIENRVIEFTDALQNAGGGVGLFYFTGHGVGLKSSKQNYLIPIGARIGKEADVSYQAVNANWVVDRMQETNPKGVNLAFLDACRSYDVPSLTQNFKNGLTEMPNPQGTMVVYATAPGKVAYTSPRENHSVFTANLLQLLQDKTKASTSIASLMIDLTAAVEPHSERLIAEVREQSPRDAEGLEPQTPWVSMSLKQHFCFREPCLSPNPSPNPNEQMLQMMKNMQERQAVLEQLLIKQQQPVVTPTATVTVARNLISGRYQDNGDGTVTDTTTNLMWKRCIEGEVWTGSNCDSPSFELVQDGNNTHWESFAGYNDWRVPYEAELNSLVWCSNGMPQEIAWKKSCSGKGWDHWDDSIKTPTIDTIAFLSDGLDYLIMQPNDECPYSCCIVAFGDAWIGEGCPGRILLVRM